jgi:pre-rRNA-processing protein TSR3
MDHFIAMTPVRENSQPFPPTVIVVHPRERASKCTVQSLRGRGGFVFRKFRQAESPALANYVCLGMDGPQLSCADAARGLLVLDGTWRLAERMLDSFRHLPLRSLPPWKTAYPRVSKTSVDPHGGLATIEAIFAAYSILGRNTDSLLDGYYWAEAFLRLNRERIGRRELVGGG